MAISFSVNGKAYEFGGPDDVPLLWVVREECGLTGPKFGCGIGMCGCCTMHVEGKAVRTCILPVGQVAGKHVTTIEGLAPNGDHPVQQAWASADVPQCGYCQPGMIMATAAFLDATPAPTDEQIYATITNLCRCATYARIPPAIHAAAAQRKPS
jgi:isoquinoline 1-oxidoreductase subunit alpha